ncbi:ROK family protein [Candidatus Saccharibacteria bacterium]|nr:ROK family protein [Candidatus Saccharibacteria bacterium]
MYLGIDVGGTKTLVARLDEHGVIKQSERFPTPQKYSEFLDALKETIDKLGEYDYRACGVGIPVSVYDRESAVAVSFGNLAWKRVHVAHDIERIVHCPVAVENDAKLAGLSEATLRPDVDKVLYVTISTGIGIGLVNDGQIDTAVGDGGGRTIMINYRGKFVPWESFASGKAIVERFGKRAADITDEATWQRIAHDLAMGFQHLIALTEPDLVVVGGSVGRYFERLKPHLRAELKAFETPLLKLPKLEEAKRPEEAVVYGCYDLVKGLYGRHRQHSVR